MKHSCDFYMDEYLSLDKGEHIPFKLTMHILLCPKCRSEVRSLLRAEKLMKKPLKIPVPIEADTISNVMKEIDPSYNPQEYKVSFRQWILTGLFMLFCLVILTVFAIPINEIVAILCYCIFTVIIVAYCGVFVGANLDFFIKKIETAKIK